MPLLTSVSRYWKSNLVVLTKRNFWWLAVKTPHEEYFDYKKKNFIKDGFKVKEVIKKIKNKKQ